MRWKLNTIATWTVDTFENLFTLTTMLISQKQKRVLWLTVWRSCIGFPAHSQEISFNSSLQSSWHSVEQERSYEAVIHLSFSLKLLTANVQLSSGTTVTSGLLGGQAMSGPQRQADSILCTILLFCKKKKKPHFKAVMVLIVVVTIMNMFTQRSLTAPQRQAISFRRCAQFPRHNVAFEIKHNSSLNDRDSNVP